MIEEKIKHIVFLVVPQATLLDITGAYEVFTQATEYIAQHEINTSFTYKLHTLSISKKKNITTSGGMVIHCEENISGIDYPIDTLIVPGVPNALADVYTLPPGVLQWLHKQSVTARRICSVCTGSFFLAATGILDNRKATTHWEKCDSLQKRFPVVKTDANSIFVKDGNVYTSAGISSGMDLALALVEEDYGKTLAVDVARQMVLYLKRPGSQSQYSTVLNYQKTDYQPVVEACEWIQENLQQVVTVENLAALVLMSPRNFARVFHRETGITPARYIERLRIEAACRYLVDTSLSLKEIAALCGLGSYDNMRKVFVKHIRISPADYRRNFNTAFGSGEVENTELDESTNNPP